MPISDLEFQMLYDSGPIAMRTVFRQLEQRIERLEQTVATLLASKNKNSHNSSKPPSSDGLKRRNLSLRKKSGLKPGGQKGHEGTTLQMSENPDLIEKHDPATCPTCNRSLKSAPRMPGYDARQVVDIPAIVSQTTEHQVFSKTCCNCGAISKGNFPVHVSQRVQYGPHLRAISTYLMNYQLLPYERTEELFKDLFGVAMSHATLARINQRSYEKLEGVESWIRQHILTQPVVHFDESGLFIDTKLHWLHTAGCTDATLYISSEKRGQDGMDVMDILPKYGGVAIHDGWKAYWKYTCKHGLCNAHHLRELKFIIEQFSQRWAKKMKRLLCTINDAIKSCKGNHLPQHMIERFEKRYTAILKEGTIENPEQTKRAGAGKRGRVAQTAARNLLKRLMHYQDSVLAFMYDFSIPFDNNLAERDIRMMKVKMKISGGFRSLGGAEMFCRIRSYISTVRKQHKNLIDALQVIYTGSPVGFLANV